MEPFERDDHTETDEPAVLPPAPVSTSPLLYEALDDDDWED